MVNTMCGSAWQALWHFFLCCVFARCATSEHHQFPPAAVICVVARHAVNTLHEFPWQSWEILRVSLVWFKLYGKQRRRKNCSANLSFFPFFFFFTHLPTGLSGQRTKQHGPSRIYGSKNRLYFNFRYQIPLNCATFCPNNKQWEACDSETISNLLSDAWLITCGHI